MNKNQLARTLLLTLSLAGAVAQSAPAAQFSFKIADLSLGFRKFGSNRDSYKNEVVVDIGQASNYVSLPFGTTIQLTNYFSSSQMALAFANYNNLQWSVNGYYGYGASSYSGYPQYTLWLSVARPSLGTQSTAPTRESSGNQQADAGLISSILGGAQQISSDIGTASQTNTSSFVAEGNSYYQGSWDLFTYINSQTFTFDYGDLQDNWDQGSLETTNAASFSGANYLDLYEVRPLTDSHGNPIVDPHTGTNGPAYYLGYFTFTSGGSMYFTRAATQPTISIALSGSNVLIGFLSETNVTYKLYGTSGNGLKEPPSSWSMLATLTGNGGWVQFTNQVTSSNRFYTVGAP